MPRKLNKRKELPFEKPEFTTEFLEELGIEKLEYHETDRPYWTGRCPFHDDNKPSFNVYSSTQTCFCNTCSENHMDIIELYKRIKHVSFNEARDAICTTLSQDQHLLRTLQQTKSEFIDVPILARQVRKVAQGLDTARATEVICQSIRLLDRGKFLQLDRMLRRFGI